MSDSTNHVSASPDQLAVNQKVDQIHTLLTPFMEAVSGSLSKSEHAAKSVEARLARLEQRLENALAHIEGRSAQEVPPVSSDQPAPAPSDQAPAQMTDAPVADQRETSIQNQANSGEQGPDQAPAQDQSFPAPPAEQPANPDVVPASDQPEVRADVTTTDSVHTDQVVDAQNADVPQEQADVQQASTAQ